MSKEERFIYHCDNYDYADIIYDTKEYEECDSMQMATNWLNRQDQRIANLEAKLVECEKEHELLIDQFEEETEKLRKQIKQESDARKRFVEEVKNLKQQLAEKEKENDKLQDKLHNYYEEVLNKGTCGLCEHLRGEYKIDFAIEQLEQTKKLIEEKYTYDVEESDWAVVYELDIDEIFDQQIKELKEGK